MGPLEKDQAPDYSAKIFYDVVSAYFGFTDPRNLSSTKIVFWERAPSRRDALEYAYIISFCVLSLENCK
jgi:hypothetical protein